MRAAINELQRRIKLLREKFRPAAIIGKGRNRRQRILIARKTAEACLHAPDGKKRAGRNAVAFFEHRKERGIAFLQRAPPRDNAGSPALCHEGIERQLETVLAPVGPDGALRIAGGHEGGNRLRLDPIGLCFGGKARFPSFEARRRLAAFGGLGRTCHQNCRRNHKKSLPSPSSLLLPLSGSERPDCH